MALAWLTGIGELVGGGFVILGAVTPLAAAGLLGIMINVVLLKLGNGFFIAGPGARRLRAGRRARAGRRRARAHRPGRIAIDNGRAWHRRPASWGVLAWRSAWLRRC